MDRKTLEYLEERAKKAREIVGKIDTLHKNIRDVRHIDKVIFWGLEHNVDIEIQESRMLEKLVIEYMAGIGKEILLLEKELEEL